MIKYSAKIFLFTIILLIPGSFKSINAQHKGQFVISLGVGIFSKGVIAVKYFPVDYFAIELAETTVITSKDIQFNY